MQKLFSNSDSLPWKISVGVAGLLAIGTGFAFFKNKQLDFEDNDEDEKSSIYSRSRESATYQFDNTGTFYTESDVKFRENIEILKMIMKEKNMNNQLLSKEDIFLIEDCVELKSEEEITKLVCQYREDRRQILTSEVKIDDILEVYEEIVITELKEIRKIFLEKCDEVLEKCGCPKLVYQKSCEKISKIDPIMHKLSMITLKKIKKKLKENNFEDVENSSNFFMNEMNMVQNYEEPSLTDRKSYQRTSTTRNSLSKSHGPPTLKHSNSHNLSTSTKINKAEVVQEEEREEAKVSYDDYRSIREFQLKLFKEMNDLSLVNHDIKYLSYVKEMIVNDRVWQKFDVEVELLEAVGEKMRYDVEAEIRGISENIKKEIRRDNIKRGTLGESGILGVL